MTWKQMLLLIISRVYLLFIMIVMLEGHFVRVVIIHWGRSWIWWMARYIVYRVFWIVGVACSSLCGIREVYWWYNERWLLLEELLILCFVVAIAILSRLELFRKEFQCHLKLSYSNWILPLLQCLCGMFIFL